MIPRDPFVLVIVYLLLAGCATWALSWALAKAKVPSPFHWIITLVIGLLLILLAFRAAGLPLFA